MRTQYTKVVVHGGQAHRDDFLCAALAVALRPTGTVAVFRRDPTFEELNDPRTLVLDVGGVHDPKLSCFDHHQRGRDEPAECALSLWAPHARVDIPGSEFDHHVDLATLLKMAPWARVTTEMDVHGPYAVAKRLGISSDALFEALSPLEASLLRMFEDATTKATGQVRLGFVDVLSDVGSRLVADLTNEYLGAERMRGARELHRVCGVEVSVVDGPSIDGMDALRRAEGRKSGVVCWHDDRGPGWACFRYDDDARVDFAKLEGHAAVTFAHKGGFMLKTKERLSVAELLSLVGLASVD